MKKLTEEWKIKKGNLRNKTFRDAIDDSFSKVSESDYVNRKSGKLFTKKSPFTNLNKSKALSDKSITSVPIRRSCRLQQKSKNSKLVGKRIEYSLNDSSFIFTESFCLKATDEANRFEMGHKSHNSDSSDVNFINTDIESTQTIQKMEVKRQNMKEKYLHSSSKRNESRTESRESSHSPSYKKIKESIEDFDDEAKRGDSCNVLINKTKDLVEDFVHPLSSEEKKVEATHKSQLSTDSCLSNKSNFEGDDCFDLTYWGLPEQVVSAYKARNINKMFSWQYECLSMKNVLNGKNLVYSAPTSAGKTLVAEILMLKNVLENKKKAMMILPFVSVVREKVNYFQEMFQDTGVVVGGYMGTHHPPGGFKATDIAICTIEKANNLVNRLMEDNRLNELGILVVDELHMLGDNSRGYLLELLLTKLLYNCKKNDVNIQIVGMSATLPNLNVLSFWLHAELYHTDFRPVPLHEMYKVGPVIYDSKTNKPLRKLGEDGILFSNDSDHTVYLTIETVASGNGVLIFCPSKNWCESLATTIAREIFNTGKPTEKEHRNPNHNLLGEKLRQYIIGSLLNNILIQLKNSPAGLDSVLKLTVPFGVAFHHAGLTFDERDIIEGAFKQGILKVLVATTTLSSGVNLPARRVLIRSPLFCGSVIDTLSYKQMVGRAGRKGIDEQGESILLCKEAEKKSALMLVSSELKPVKSCLMKSGKDGLHASLKRAIIEVIASGAATTHEDIKKYASCTLLFASLIQENSDPDLSENNVEDSLNKCLDYLLDNDFIFKIVKTENDFVQTSYKPSQLGTAILASGFSPEDSLRVLKELQLARQCFVLENDLHILYEVTPPYLSDQMGSLNWMTFLTIWEQLPEDYRRVGELVGVRESFIGLGIQGKIKMASVQAYHKLAVHQRFYAALALNELIQEVPLSVVSEKYNCNRGILQSLQQTTSTFSGMLTVFCNRLGWYNLELLFSHFQKRVHFGIQQELCELIQLSTLNAQRARVLYNAGYETISSVASADLDELEFVLCNAGAFESEKQLDGDAAEAAIKKREVKRIRITGKESVNERDAANLIIREAQDFIKHELGIKTISWQAPKQAEISTISKKPEKREINNKCNNDISDSKYTETSKNDKTSKINKISANNPTNIDMGSISARDSNKSCFIVSTGKTNLNPTESLDKHKPLNQESSKHSLNLTYKENNDQNNKASQFKGSSSNLAVIIPVAQNVENSLSFSCSQDKANVDLEKNKASISVISDKNKVPANESYRDHSNFNKDSTSQNDALIVDSNVNVVKNSPSFDCNNGKDQLISSETQKNNFQKTICEKNETYFDTEGMNSLFSVLEKTFQEANEEKMAENEILNQNNDLTFSQLLLAQSAEVESIYHVQSFINCSMDTFSFSDCLEDNCDANAMLSTSKREEMQIKFTNKKTRDILDAIFDSPASEENASIHKAKKTFLNCESLQLSSFELSCDNSILSKENNPISCHQSDSLKNCFIKFSNATGKDLEKGELRTEKEFSNSNCPHLKRKDRFDIVSINKNPTSQSTPKGNVPEVKCCENIYSPIETSFSNFTEKLNLNSSGLNFIDNRVKENSSKDSNSFTCCKKTETSGDLFESEDSIDSDLFNKIQAKDLIAKDDIHSISSGSNEIFTSNNSFEGMLENPNNIPNLQDINLNSENGKAILCHAGENLDKIVNHEDEVRINLDEKNLASHSQLTPNTVKQIALENSGDIFEDSASVEQVFINPKKHLSFEFEDNSDIFKSWNTPPCHTLCPDSKDKKEISQKQCCTTSNKNALNNESNFSFLANMSDFSNILSNSAKNCSLKNDNLSKGKPLQLSNSKIRKNADKSIVKEKTEDKLTSENNEINGECVISPNLHIKFENSVSVENIHFSIVDISEDEFCNFLKILGKVPMFGISVAVETSTQKQTKNIGPPKFREKKCSMISEKIYVEDGVLIAGLAFCWSEKVYFMKFPTDSNDDTNSCYLINMKTKLKALQKLFHSFSSKSIVAYDIKSYYGILHKSCHIALAQNKDVTFLDPSIAAWLLDPCEGQLTLQELVLNYWPEALHVMEGFDRSQRSLGLQHWSSVPGRQRATTEAFISFHLIDKLLNFLKERKLYKSFVDIEMQSIITLAEMEQNGLGFELKLAMEYRKELQKKQSELLKKAYQLAGHSFNIMSSRDLSRILYKELKLIPDVSKSPMLSRQLSLGIVTRNSNKKLPPELKANKDCLEKIMHLHPLPKVITDWRKLSFAISKVLMPLLRENKYDNTFQMNRIHSTCYVYTVTGRINMHKPNLQFIPRDFSIDDNTSEIQLEKDSDEFNKFYSDMSQYGVCLRNMFIASEGNVLISADYSQLELRILAHLSGDVKLLKSLNSGDDIFKQIAASWKNIPTSSVTDEIRQQAKKICYGIIYGMSPKTLSHQLKTSENDASYFMETFKRSYPGMTNYLTSVLENCRRKGYVTTIMERRRYLPHILSENKGERAHAERQAINTTVQGSAADVIKKAMIEIDKQLTHLFGKDAFCHTEGHKGEKQSRNLYRGAFLVLQLHDELIYEVNKSNFEVVKNIIKNVMETATTLSVILPVNVKVGSSWGSMKEVS